MSLEGWAVVGTFIGVVLGGVAIWQAHRQRMEEEAARLRSALRAYRTSFAETVHLLGEEGALIDPIWRGVDLLGERVDISNRQATLDFVEDERTRNGIAVQAWSTSSISGEVRASLRALTAARIPITGRVAFFVAAGAILDQLVNEEDDFPPAILETLLGPEVIGEPLTQVSCGDLSGQDARVKIASFLQERGRADFKGHYHVALSKLNMFVGSATRALEKLDASALTSLARSKRVPNEAGTMIGDIEARLGEVGTKFCPGEETRMWGILAEIDGLLEERRGEPEPPC
jgi:hypothetical protein